MAEISSKDRSLKSKGFTPSCFNCQIHTAQGEEGKQGPYQLRGERGETEIIVLAGTERVWIDGEIMTRGEENDYVIEYGSGQVTFTRNRLVTGDSRIEIDFEYSNLRFQRNLYSARFSGSSFNSPEPLPSQTTLFLST